MISIYYNTDDQFSRYGVNHFIEKFGIPIQINKPSKSGIIIAYGVQIQGTFVIDIEENEIKNTICGKISTKYEKIPLCEKPRDTGSDDEVIALFENEDSKYPCVTRNDHGFSIGVDIFKETGYILSGHLDSLWQSLDTTTKKELASKPVVDFLENILFQAILAGCHKRNIPLIQNSYWPEGKKFAVCLTHDVDELPKSSHWFNRSLRYLIKRDIRCLIGQINSFKYRMIGIKQYSTFEDIIRIEDSLNVKSTYFILKESGKASLFSKNTWHLFGRNRKLQSPEMQALILQLTSHGDEIAIHGSFYSYKDPEMILNETRELEQLINHRIIGIRQHHLNLDIPKTWEDQIQADLKYDSSLGFKDIIGFRWGTSFPFFPNTKKESLPILEIPLIIMDNCLESYENKERDCLNIAEEVKNHDGVLMLLWHPPVFNTLKYPVLRETYIKIIQYCQEKGSWVARATDIYEWLSARNKQNFSYFYQGSICKIIPTFTGSEFFFTLHLPPHFTCDILSGNAQVILREGDCVYIKTHNLNNNNEIVIEIA